MVTQQWPFAAIRSRLMGTTVLAAAIAVVSAESARADDAKHNHDDHHGVTFDAKSVKSGRWSDSNIWQSGRVPRTGDRVLIDRNTHVFYDVASHDVIRLLQVLGTLEFVRDRDTELNVALLKVQNSDVCSEHGFACDFLEVNAAGEPHGFPDGPRPALLVGTRESPIPAEHTARIRLHYLEGLSETDAPAIACCSARMEFHGAPLSRTWVKLGADAAAGATTVAISEKVSGWRVGDEVIVTATRHAGESGTFRDNKQSQTEERRITAIQGTTITLDRPLAFAHRGAGEFRGEVANLSRNVVIESADSDGVRGHTVYHRYSQGGISFARFAHLGKEGVLGRYAIHFHLVEDTMRGSCVEGVAVVDSHNRWVTVHGTQYLVVRDCVGYQSVGHGFFLEDGTETHNLLDRNLAVQAYRGRRLPKQVLPFDPNDGAGFWWANGLNTITHNVSCENDEYGYRYDMQKRSNFDPTLFVRQPDGSRREVDVRTIPIWRFQDNEAHAEGFYGMVVAANGNDQPDTPITNQRALERMRAFDWTGPNAEHPHVIRGLSIWGSHYAFRPHSPCMLMEDVRIDDAAYGIYRPAFENHVYRNLHISDVGAEPFNRGMDDASAQTGSISVDGLTFESGYGNRSTPLVQISDNDLSGSSVTHFRNVNVLRAEGFEDRWPLINRGVGPRPEPVTEHGVAIVIHHYFGPGRHLRVVSTEDPDLASATEKYAPVSGITGDEAVACEVKDVEWPELLTPVDDLPPITVITDVERVGDRLRIKGIAHDNGEIASIVINQHTAMIVANAAGVVDWSVELPASATERIAARSEDAAGNVELTPHIMELSLTHGLP